MSDLIPVPKGMCPAFYQFMGAGAPRSDSGEILMLSAKGPAMSEIEAAAERVRRCENGDDLRNVYDVQFCADAVPLAYRDQRACYLAFIAQQPTYADLTAKLAAEKREHLATQELHERSMRMIEEAIGPTRDLFEGWRAEVSAKAIASIVSQLSTCIEQLAAAEKRLAHFDDPTPLTGYYVQNLNAGYVGNNPVFWAKGGNGYTSYIDNAEVFAAKDAFELLSEDPSKWRVWPAAAVHECVYRTVESQTLKRSKAVTAKQLATGLGIQLKEDA